MLNFASNAVKFTETGSITLRAGLASGGLNGQPAQVWLEVEDTSLKAGVAWAAVGLVYLAWLTGGFRRAAPQLHEEIE